MNYTGVLEPRDEAGFTVQCVEIPGAISQGETREEALATIQEAIEHVPAVRREEFPEKTSTLRPEISKNGSGRCRISFRSFLEKTW